jgi:hypothetical protein
VRVLEKTFMRSAFWSIYAVPLALLTITATGPLTALLMWGTIHIPRTASYESVLAAIGMEPVVFLLLLAIPKVAIYFIDVSERSLKKTLWSMAAYLVLPILIWLLFFMTVALSIGWFLIALAAWIEALQIVFAKRLSEGVRTAWHLD